MAGLITLIDTSLWVDFTRARTPRVARQYIAPYLLAGQARIAEPIIFEVLRSAAPHETAYLTQQLGTVPVLDSPIDLWRRAAGLGQACRAQGFAAGPLDLLIASVALYHGATVVTLDTDFERIAIVSDLLVNRLQRPTA